MWIQKFSSENLKLLESSQYNTFECVEVQLSRKKNIHCIYIVYAEIKFTSAKYQTQHLIMLLTQRQ